MRINTTCSLILLGLLLTVCGCSDSNNVSKPEPIELTERVAMLMGAWPHANAIIETGKATAVRIGKDDQFKENTLGERIDLTSEQRQTLVGLLAREDAYLWDIQKDCLPTPGVLIEFTDGATYARVRLCFSCQMVEYTPGSSGNFDPINTELVDWVKGVFPEDEAIQSLGTPDAASGL
ncbi:MAG: hypothetical protein AB8C95_11325 [Phycisphaeraceae bacterium]